MPPVEDASPCTVFVTDLLPRKKLVRKILGRKRTPCVFILTE